LEIAVATRVVDGRALCRVQDNGRGIDPHIAARVFDLFVQGDKSGGGAGFGLALVRDILRRFGGRIWLDDQAGTLGACFVFSLPQADGMLGRHG
jgi:signal transduction histidine kinase